VEQHSDLVLWREYRLAITFLARIRLLRRLMDGRNPGLDMDSEPQPDGPNIKNRHLRNAWILHRAWIRALHYRSLSIGDDLYGWEQIQQIMVLVTLFLAFEDDDHGFNPVERQQNPVEFEVFASYYDRISQALDNIGDEIRTETRLQTGDTTYTEEETVIYNIFPERFTHILRKVGSGSHSTVFGTT
jgi:hypothetical protein